MAINFSGVNRRSIAGRAARSALSLIPSTTVLPVVQGQLKGMRWVVGSSIHGCWLGSFDQTKLSQFREHIRPGQVVYDIGANVGYYTLLASRLAGPSGRVICFEPLPRNLSFLRRHVELNRASGGRSTANVTVVDAAVSDHQGTAVFTEGAAHDRAHLVGMGDRHVDRDRESADPDRVQGGIRVRVVSIDALAQRGQDPLPPPDVLKIDVEGAEATVLRGGEKTILAARPVIFMATHGPEVHRECCDLLRSWGYTLMPIDTHDIDTAEELVAHPGAAPVEDLRRPGP